MNNQLKKIELFLKKKINKLISNKFEPILIEKPTDSFKNIQKILLLRQDRIGDLLISVPLIKVLNSELNKNSSNQNNVKIDIVLSKKNYGAKKAIEKYVNKIFIYDKKIPSTINLIRNLNKNNYDLIIDLFDNASATSNFFLKYVKSTYKLGLSKENNSQYTHIVPLEDKSKVHIIDRIANLLLPFNINPKDIKFELEYPINPEEKKSVEQEMKMVKNKLNIGIVLSGSSPAKFWGKENIINYIKTISNTIDNTEFYLFGISKQKEILDEIQNHTNCKVAPFTTDLHKFAVQLSLCNIILTPDTSAVHYASAFKIPAIVLYQKDPQRNLLPWFPYNSPHIALITETSSLSDISVEKAVIATKEIMNYL